MGITREHPQARWLRKALTKARAALALLPTLALLAACASQQTYAVHFKRHPETPASASVIIDEQYVGPLAYVAGRGVRVEAGEHRISIEKNGYFPYDKLVDAEQGTIQIEVEMVPIPD